MIRLQPVSQSNLFTAVDFRAPPPHHCIIVAKRAANVPVVIRRAQNGVSAHEGSEMSNEPKLRVIGVVQSLIKTRADAPKQGLEGAPDVWLDMSPNVAQGLDGISVGDEIIVITWFHLSLRDVLTVHPRGDKAQPLTGVFDTRSPDRPNPLGLHKVMVKQIAGLRLLVGPMEAIDGTPIVDIKPVLSYSQDF